MCLCWECVFNHNYTLVWNGFASPKRKLLDTDADIGFLSMNAATSVSNDWLMARFSASCKTYPNLDKLKLVFILFQQ